jgi:hypothetical protein
VVLVAAAILLPVLKGNAREPSQPESHPVVLISIDGLRPDYVTEADRHGLAIPNLRRLLREGAHATGVRGVFPPSLPQPRDARHRAAPRLPRYSLNTTFDPSEEPGGWYRYASDLTSPAPDAAAERRLTVASVPARHGRCAYRLEHPAVLADGHR